MRTEDYSIQLKNLSIGYKKKEIARNINLGLRPGTITAIMGRNGSGKSTLIKTIMGLLPPLAGDIYIHGKNLKDYEGVELALKVSVVLTEPVVTRELTVEELVSYGRYPHTSWLGKLKENDRELIKASIQETGLNGFENRQIYSLSDGELQRAMIAKGLAQQSPVMILDEPTSHLDIFNRKQIVGLLRRLAEEKGMTVLFSSHELELVREFADDVWLIYGDGRVKKAIPGEFVD